MKTSRLGFIIYVGAYVAIILGACRRDGPLRIAESSSGEVETKTSDGSDMNATRGSSQIRATAVPNLRRSPPANDVATYLQAIPQELQGWTIMPIASEREFLVQELLGGSARVDPKCKSIYQQMKSDASLVEFSCARDPGGQLWTVAGDLQNTSTPECPDGRSGSWKLTVHSTDGALATSAKRDVCYVNAVDCWESRHPNCYARAFAYGVGPPTGFWFFQPTTKSIHSFLYAVETPNASGPKERSILWWTYQGGNLEVHPVGKDAAVFLATKCAGPLTIIVNPYRTAGDDFSINFGGYNRKSSPEWALLAVVNGGDAQFNHELSKRFAARLCEGVPELLFSADPYWWPHHLHCRKLLGDSRKLLKRRLNEACATPKSIPEQEFCAGNHEELRKIVTATLPLTLTEDEARSTRIPECLTFPDSLAPEDSPLLPRGGAEPH